MIKARFIHIPKTAGTSVLSILNFQYPFTRKLIFRGGSLNKWKELTPRQQAAIGIVTGHANFHTGIEPLDAAPTFTLLRHPVERAASFCRHVLDPRKKHYLREREGFHSIDAMLENPNRELINLQTSILLLTHEQVHSMNPLDFDGMENPAAKALGILTHRMRAFGIQEQFDTSMLLIARSFGWRPPVYLARNESDRSLWNDFTPAQINKIESLNALDIELYDAACKNFCGLVDGAGWLEDEMQRFHRWQKVSHPLLKLQQRLKRR